MSEKAWGCPSPTGITDKQLRFSESRLLLWMTSPWPAAFPYAYGSPMDAWTSCGLQSSTPEGVVGTCLLYVGCGQLLHCQEPCSQVHLIWGSCSALGDFEQESSIVVIDKSLSLFGNIPMPTLRTHWFSIGWLILAETWRFRRQNHRKRFGVSFVREETERGE